MNIDYKLIFQNYLSQLPHQIFTALTLYKKEFYYVWIFEENFSQKSNHS